MSPTVDRPVCSSRDSAPAVVVIVVFWLLVQKILEKIHFLIFFVYLFTVIPSLAHVAGLYCDEHKKRKSGC